MNKTLIVVILTVINCCLPTIGVTISKSAYRDVVVEIEDSVPREKCVTVLTELERSLNTSPPYRDVRKSMGMIFKSIG
ncbi:hypothetical protein DMENIID0001_020720 [Sergentomyia squamirostris]